MTKNIGYKILELIDATRRSYELPADALVLDVSAIDDGIHLWYSHDPAVKGTQQIDAMIVNINTKADVGDMTHIGIVGLYDARDWWHVLIEFPQPEPKDEDVDSGPADDVEAAAAQDVQTLPDRSEGEVDNEAEEQVGSG